MKPLTLSAICTVLSLLLVGCNSATTQSIPVENHASATKAASSTADSANSAVTLETVTCNAWKQSLAAQKGHIVVVDTWATWCMPCREEFPKLLELDGKYASLGVTFMSVSVDESDQKDNTLKFLQQKQSTISNYLIDDKPEAWWDLWDIKGIPIVLVFGRDGQLVRKFDNDDPDNQFTYEDVEKLLKELLEAPAS